MELFIHLRMLFVCLMIFWVSFVSAETEIHVGPNQQFQHIQSAVQYAATLSDDVVIRVAAGTYNQPVVIDGFNSFSLKLEGVAPRAVVLDGESEHTPIRISHCQAPISIINIDITNGLGEYDVVDQAYEGCVFGNSYQYYLSYLNLNNVGGGLFAWDLTLLAIANCKFSSNTADHGLGLFACDASINIDQCEFSNHGDLLPVSSSRGTAICTYMSNVSVKGTRFCDNLSGYDVVSINQLHARDSYLFSIESSLFNNNYPLFSVIDVIGYPSSRAEITNCTVASNYVTCGPALKIEAYLGAGPQLFSAYLRNNILTQNISSELFVNNEGAVIDMGDHQVYVPYEDKAQLICHNNNYHDINMIENEVYDNCTGIASEFYDNIDSPPLFVDPAVGDFSLLWSASAKSPCINAGYPGENFDLTDPDGTPPDIGCVYYPHYHKEYFDCPSLIKWMSFPVVDDRSITDDMHWDELRHLFNTQMMFAPNSQLNQIQWSYDGESPTMKFITGVWHNGNERTIQPKGYKVQFNQGMINTVVVNGFKADPDTTPTVWTVDVEENGQIRSFENWIGYFVPYTQNAEIALSRLIPGTLSKYLDYVHTIKTRTWGTCRYAPELGSPWIAEPEKYTFSEGDMVILLLIPHAPDEMYWSNDGVDTKPVIRPQATAFTYEEKLDYTSVFIEFNPEDMPDEVGLYVNGVCMGAAVVDSSLIDVCFYNETAKDGGELEIVFYYEGKGKQAAKGWTSYNPDSMVFENSGIDVNNIGDYAYISFKSGAGDSPVPLFTSLQLNYPNPFNHSTNISFILSKDMNARLDIYNVRGQRVKTMLNAAIGKGKHTLEWSGRDEHGRPVSSGIYFSRLTTPEGVFSQKMMLMK